jgi:hypothetical protein
MIPIGSQKKRFLAVSGRDSTCCYLVDAWKFRLMQSVTIKVKDMKVGATASETGFLKIKGLCVLQDEFILIIDEMWGLTKVDIRPYMEAQQLDYLDYVKKSIDTNRSLKEMAVEVSDLGDLRCIKDTKEIEDTPIGLAYSKSAALLFVVMEKAIALVDLRLDQPQDRTKKTFILLKSAQGATFSQVSLSCGKGGKEEFLIIKVYEG